MIVVIQERHRLEHQGHPIPTRTRIIRIPAIPRSTVAETTKRARLRTGTAKTDGPTHSRSEIIGRTTGIFPRISNNTSPGSPTSAPKTLRPIGKPSPCNGATGSDR